MSLVLQPSEFVFKGLWYRRISAAHLAVRHQGSPVFSRPGSVIVMPRFRHRGVIEEIMVNSVKIEHAVIEYFLVRVEIFRMGKQYFGPEPAGRLRIHPSLCPIDNYRQPVFYQPIELDGAGGLQIVVWQAIVLGLHAAIPMADDTGQEIQPGYNCLTGFADMYDEFSIGKRGVEFPQIE